MTRLHLAPTLAAILFTPLPPPQAGNLRAAGR